MSKPLLKIYGDFYYVRVERGEVSKTYIVKMTHLDEFVALMQPFDCVVVCEIVKTSVEFDHRYQWYKPI